MALTNDSFNPSDVPEVDRGFTPKFDAKQPIEKDGIHIISGTALFSFQGHGVRTKTNGTTGELFSREGFVYACLTVEGKFKNISVEINEESVKLAFDKMTLDISKIENENLITSIAGLEGFGGLYNFDKIPDAVYSARGKLFTGIMVKKQYNNGSYYFDLLLETLKPVMVNGEHKQLQKPEHTKPNSIDFELDK